MSDQGEEKLSNKEYNEKMRAALASKKPLPVDLLRKWLAANGWPYRNFAKRLHVSESRIKYWINTRKEITPKSEKAVRDVIKRILACEEAGQFCPISPEDNTKLYRISPELYTVLEQIGKWRLKTLDHLISDVLFSWIAEQIKNGALDRAVLKKEGIGSTINGVITIKNALKKELQRTNESLLLLESTVKNLQGIKIHSDSKAEGFNNTLVSLVESSVDQESKYRQELKMIHEVAEEFERVLYKEIESRPPLQYESMYRIKEICQMKKARTSKKGKSGGE